MTYFLVAVAVILVFLPRKWDPAIRWKEYNIRVAEKQRVKALWQKSDP